MGDQLRTAVVTGAGSGLGRALALELAGRGAELVVADIDAASVEETARLVREVGVRVEASVCDVADRAAVFALVEACDTTFGSVDLIANNAGVAVAGDFETVEMEHWKWIVDINMWGVIYGCQAALPKMKKQGRGYIVNVASAAGLMSTPGMAPYNVTKAAVVSLSETLYGEAKSRGVNVSVVCPTFFTTGILEAGRGESDPKMEAYARGRMRASKVQAPQVAQQAIDAVLNGKLYVTPMADGRAMWRFKRLSPQRFYDSLNTISKRLAK